MVRTLEKHGDGHALVLRPEDLAALGITGDSPVEVRLENGALVVRPASEGAEPDDVARAVARLRPRYEGMLRKLAE